jgi:hypothetical protein
MATSTPHDSITGPQLGSGQDLGGELLPLIEETPAEYLARLKALHARVGALIDAIETRRPILGPVPARPVRAAADRRTTETTERRLGIDDRRTGLPEIRSVPYERRFGMRDRRHDFVDRREDSYSRRREPATVPWEGPLRLNRVTLMWVLQVAAWVAVAAIALIYGIGN